MENIKSFLEYLEKARNLSPQTVRAYEIDLTQLAEFYAEYKPGADICDADYLALRHFLGYLAEQDISKRSIARKVSALKAFYKYLMILGKITKNPTAALSTPRFEGKLPTFVSPDNTAKIFALAEEQALSPDFSRCSTDAQKEKVAVMALRDLAILEVLYGCGIRAAELVGLTEKSIDFKGGFLDVIGKGDKERLVPFGEKAKQALVAYSLSRDKLGPKKDVAELFLTRNGNALSTRSVQRIIARLCGGVVPGVSPHTWRHTCATHMLEGDAALTAIQSLLGHANISTTVIYTHITVERMIDQYEQYHPFAGGENEK